MTFFGYEVYNDLHLVGTYLLLMVLFFFILFLSILAHELGHVLYFYFKLKKKIKINFKYNNIWSFKWRAGTQADYDALLDKDYVGVNRWGILFGLVPIIIASFAFVPMILLVVPYIVGCWSDIKEIAKNTKWEDEH